MELKTYNKYTDDEGTEFLFDKKTGKTSKVNKYKTKYLKLIKYYYSCGADDNIVVSFLYPSGQQQIYLNCGYSPCCCFKGFNTTSFKGFMHTSEH